MALGTYFQMVQDRLPFLADTQENQDRVDRFKEEAYMIVGPKIGLETENDILDDANYTLRTKMLIAELVTCQYIERRILENTDGNAAESTAGGQRRIKKAKADVVEAEFEYPKGTDQNSLVSGAKDIYANSKKRACALAQEIGIELSLCAEPSDTYTPPFLFLTNPDEL